MQLTYLGHASFLLETSTDIVITDPWLSDKGAFDSAWFQYPCNHHMADYVQHKLALPNKEKFIYISHEHKDHLDLEFMNSLHARDFTLVLPKFRRDHLHAIFDHYQCKSILACTHRQKVAIPSGYLELYLDDSEHNRDSALFIEAEGFRMLNLNDCKINDELPNIKQEYGHIDVFSAQFSGATWHPTCYDYPQDHYSKLSRKKMMGKFNTVARSIETLAPRFYIPSAGPPCFLDPTLIQKNFETVNIFPRTPVFLKYLEKRLKIPVTCPEMMPGDILDIHTGQFIHHAQERVDEAHAQEYIENYAKRYRDYFTKLHHTFSEEENQQVLHRLSDEMQKKLDQFTLHERIQLPLYVSLTGVDPMLKIDFVHKRIERVHEISEDQFYSMRSPAWQIQRVLDRHLTWEDWCLTFRIHLERHPDEYHPLIHGFLILEAEDLNAFCAKTLEREAHNERMIVEAEGCRYEVDRYCPHQGADLKMAWVEGKHHLVCPRHRWTFDLEQEGACTTNYTSIHAKKL